MTKINYNNTRPTAAIIDGKAYRFRSLSEFYFAVFLWFKIHKQKPNKQGNTIISFEYEPELFSFDVAKRNKTKAYRPDFLVHYNDGTAVYVEIKGRMDAGSRVKIKLFNEQVSQIKVVLTNSGEFAYIRTMAKKLLNHPKIHNFIQWKIKPNTDT